MVGEQLQQQKTSTCPITINNTYMTSIYVTVEEHTTMDKLVPEFFNQDYMNYINLFLLKLSIEKSNNK
jgi:hypothetical protein